MTAEASPKTLSDSTAPVERIYVGGLNPQRLSIEDVADRLRRIVDVVSIETCGERQKDDCFAGRGPSFFYVNARYAEKENSEDSRSSATAKAATALQVLSKAYNNVKWKGCTIRVEAARPHFLDRLKLERNQRERERDHGDALAHAENGDITAAAATTTATKNTTGNEVVCPPRNLRIRRRFGEEAFRVDTKPIDVSSTDGFTTNNATGVAQKWSKSRSTSTTKRGASEMQWNNFSEALDKLRRKRAKHADQYAEQIRRLKRQAKGRGPKDGGGVDTMKDIGSPNAKVFLNRAVHVRFIEDEDNFAGSPARRLSHVYVATSSDEESSASGSSSSSSSSVDEISLASLSSKDGENNDNGSGAIKSNDYVWSDEEPGDDEGEDKVQDDDRGQNDESDEEASNKYSAAFHMIQNKSDVEVISSSELEGSSEVDNGVEAEEQDGRAETSMCGYAWSDDDVDGDSSSELTAKDGVSSSDRHSTTHVPGGCKECSTPTDYDEFSSAVNFSSGTRDYVGKEDIVDNDEANSIISDSEVRLDKDVSTNLSVLGQLFPELTSTKPNIPNRSANRGNVEVGGQGTKTQNSRPGWGMNGLMQRYDPNDTKSAKLFEVGERVNTKQNQTLQDTDESIDGEETSSKSHSNSDSGIMPSDVTSASSEESEGDAEDEDNTKTATDDTPTKVEEADTQTENKPATSNDQDDRKEIYEQGKLEGIFQEARSGEGCSGFQMSDLFGDKLTSSAPKSNISNASGVGTSDATETAPSAATNGFSFSFKTGMPAMGESEDVVTSVNEQQNSVYACGNKPSALVSKPDESIRVDSISNVLNTEQQQRANMRRRGMSFSQSLLDELEASFFRMNEGERVLHDYEAMKDDARSQNAWNEERKLLTMDWKRKQKHAVSQKQKRRK